jgi:hypothetical protein
MGGCDDEKGAGGGIKMHARECEAKLSVIAGFTFGLFVHRHFTHESSAFNALFSV